MSQVQNKRKCKNPKDILRKELTKLIDQYSSDDFALPSDIPTKWEKHGDLILLPSDCFQDPIWYNFGTLIITILFIVCFIV